MDPVVTLLLILGAVFTGAILWFRLAHDPVGYRERRRRLKAGLQGRLDEWLYWQAPLSGPPMKKLFTHEPQPGDAPWFRALQVVIRAEALRTNVEPQAAYAKLQARYRSPLALAFLRGRVRTAIQTHWRSRYGGPDALFYPWFFLVAYPRYGRRHLYLDTLSAALEEFRTA